MIHRLLQKGTGITGDWLSFYLISLGFLLRRIRLSFPLWSTRKTQLPLLGLAKDISSTQRVKWAVCGDCFITAINKQTTCQALCYIFLSLFISKWKTKACGVQPFFSNSSKRINVKGFYYMKKIPELLHFHHFITLWMKSEPIRRLLCAVQGETDRQTFRFSCDCVWVKRATSRRARPK